MKKGSWRLLISLVLSLSGVAGTHLWYKSYQSHERRAGFSSPIARVLELSDEVMRKPTDRLIWQRLGMNDVLFDGDQIRTGDLSTVRLEFVEGATVVDIEPGSLITVERDQGNLLIDFIQGHLFVQESAEPGRVQLKGAGGRVQAIQPKTTIARRKDGRIEVESLEQSSAPTPTGLEVLEPSAFAEVYVDPLKAEDFVLWKLRASEDVSQFKLEVGPRRDRLQPIETKFIETSPNQLAARLSPGNYFWRLSSGDGRKSAIRRLKVLPLRSLIPIAPQKDLALEFDQAIDVRFEWSNPGGLTNITLEVAKTQDLRGERQVFRLGQKDWKLLRLSQEGSYFWRVTGYLRNSGKPLVGPVQEFQLRAKPRTTEAVKKTPSHSTPADLAVITEPTGPVLLPPPKWSGLTKEALRADLNGQLQVAWEPVAEARAYRVDLVSPQGKLIQTVEVSEPKARFEALPPGDHELKVFAISAAGFKGQASEGRPVSVPHASDARAPAFKGFEIE